MKKILSLLKATMSQDMSLFKLKSDNHSKIQKRILPIFLSIVVMFSIGSYAFMLADVLAPNNLTYIMLTIFILVSSLLTLIEGIYKSQGILFEAKDTDLLFSLPILKSQIIFTKLFKLITFEIFYNLLFMLPSVIVYVIYEKPSFSFYIVSLIMLILLPIIPTIIACVIGYIIKGIVSKFKSRNILQIILTTIFLLFIFYASFNLESMINNIAQSANTINEIITKIYYPAGLYIDLILKFDILQFIVFILINIIPAILFVVLASKFYFNIVSKLSEKRNSTKNINNKSSSKMFKNKAQLMALIIKDVKRFFSSPVFVINAGFGLVLIVVITIGISINFNGFIERIFK